jgi:hypothetical protein
MDIRKQPAFFEGTFEISNDGAVSGADENLLLMAIVMMALLERRRG